MTSSSDIEKWADKAMYAQDPMGEADAGPRVRLLWMTPDPLGAAAAMNGMYPGPRHLVPQSLADVSRSAREAILEDMQKTILALPLEAITFHFVIENVTRAFTHQLVRNRTSGFAQESMRFAVVGADGRGIPVKTPPSILDRQAGTDQETFESIGDTWRETVQAIEDAYLKLVASGVPAEDARGILPTNITTRIQWVTNLRSLQNELGKRLTTQAQFEWRRVVAEISRAIAKYNPHQQLIDLYQSKRNQSGYEGSDPWIVREALQMAADSERWQYRSIAQLFRPVCYKTGKCEFMGEADRFCTIRERVQQNAAIGRSSRHWDETFYVDNPDGSETPVVGIQPINPEEWYADPTAAR